MPKTESTLMQLPRSRRNIKRMRVTDASDDGTLVCLECLSCGHKEKWVRVQSVKEAKRGIPCPKCNKEQAE